MEEKIAIIGIGIIAPEAHNKEEFWENVKKGKNCVGEVSKDRWDPELYWSPDRKAADKTYSKIGGFVRDFAFDPIKYKIPPSAAGQISRLQKMTIEAARMVLEDSGYDKKDFNREKTAVLMGNAMGAMRKELTDFRVYKFFNEELMRKTGVFSSLPPQEQEKLLKEYEEGIDASIIKITEDTMPGELSNVTAGRIANVFNLKGPNMTFDAACASSMAAVDYAVLGLRSGKFDMAVCGGADEMMSPPAYVKFCKIGALSDTGSWVFDERANGFVMAEAVSLLVLKRLSDAIRDKDRIYAVINSVGASSDGKGKGITAPNPAGQKLAIENAFRGLDYTPADIGLIEAHGTATIAGDAAELAVLDEIFSKYQIKKQSVGLGSVKSQIGHSKAAAGAVSLAKIALALKDGILPPSINFERSNRNIDFENSPFRVITEKQEWKTGKIKRANVSSFGFGGTNFHVTMEEYRPGANYSVRADARAESETAFEVRENLRIPFENLQGEAVTFTASSPEGLLNEIKKAKKTALELPPAYPMAKFSAPLNEMPQKEWGVSMAVKSPEDLAAKAGLFEKNFGGKIFSDPPLTFKLKSVYPFKKSENRGKIGFLFPGQGSQYVDMMRDLAAKYSVVRETFEEADEILEKMINVRITDVLWSKSNENKEELEKREAAIKQTQMTQPAVLAADIAMMRLLTSFGIKPAMACGHSLGEYAAATAAGVFTFENGLRAVTSRAKEMSHIKVKDPGKMASVAWPADKVGKELKKINGYVICANKNCPIQTVIAGEKKAVEQAVDMFVKKGVQAQEIPVSHAFHSAIIKPAIKPYREFLEKIPISTAKIPLLSNVTADYFPGETRGIYDLLVEQMTSPVEFIRQLERMYEDGTRVFIECGPKRVLSAFAAATMKDRKDVTILASNHPKRGGILEFNDLLANLMAFGFDLNWSGKRLEAGNRFYNSYYLGWAKTAGKTGEEKKKQGGAPYVPSSSTPKSAEIAELAEKFGFNFNTLAFSGISAGTPGTWDSLFRENNLDEILDGKNLIETIPEEWRKRQVEKNIVRVIKSPTGDSKIETVDSVEDAIKLSARKGQFDIAKEFGLPPTIVKALADTSKMAIGAGILALKDAGIPLIHYYKKTTTGGYLPLKWALPGEVADETGVIFASAFPIFNTLIEEITSYFNYKHKSKPLEEMWEVYDKIAEKLPEPADKKIIRDWIQRSSAGYSAGDIKDKHVYSQNFLLKVIPIADSQFAQWVGAKGPIIHLSAACSSTTQAIHTAEAWIRAGKAKRVVVIGADDISSESVQEWTMPGFLASGTATNKAKVSEAALPFDRRRHGLIVGSAAVGFVLEDETLIRERGMKPLARLLLTEAANSAYHVTKLDTGHVSEVMENFVKKIENIYGMDKKDFAGKTVFISHETYTPARGGSASAEVKALKKAFGEHAGKVIVSNVKGFTGHTMGASLEDAIAVRTLNTGLVPPIANYKVPDPELAGINLSKGGKYDLEYSLRFAAGFGSHMGMSFMQKTYSAGEMRIENENLYKDWLRKISGDDNPELEVVYNTLRVKDRKADSTQAPETPKIKSPPLQPEKEKVCAGPAAGPETAPAAKIAPVKTPRPSHAVFPDGLDAQIRGIVLDIVTQKTGYPEDMLELDLDMEADLGIDTVKQAELFAAIREHFGLPRRENLSLKDYPTIRHCVKYVMDEKGVAAPAPSPAVAGKAMADKPAAAAPVQKTSQTPPAPAAPSDGLDEGIKKTVLGIVTEKTGYPEDMLELDLDMEADLGIDTVKQAELFAAIREHFGLPRRENLSLKDYPTIRHCVKYVMDEKGQRSPEKAAEQEKPRETETQTEEEYSERHIRYIPVLIDKKAGEEIPGEISTLNPIVIIIDDMELAVEFRKELDKNKASSHIFTSRKTNLAAATRVNWSDAEEVDASFANFASKNKVRGIIYLLGATGKKLGISTNALEDLKKHAFPLFLAVKRFLPSLTDRSESCRTFIAAVTKVDGSFGYETKEAFNPVTAAVNGITLCARKEAEGKARVKLLDFEKGATNQTVVQKTFYEILYSDERTLISYKGNGRRTLFFKPAFLKPREILDLRGKKILITGGGRGLGALFAQMLAEKRRPDIILSDVIYYGEESKSWSRLDDKGLGELKAGLWKKMKAENPKATPIMLEKEFTRIKDSAALHKTLLKLREIGASADYFQCDLNDERGFKAMISQIREKHGPLDGVVHFAGLERSKLMTEKSPEEFFLIFNTKANSAVNLLNSRIVKEGGFWVFISSIAGKFGNLGQSDYAAASDYISKLAVSLRNKGYKAVAADMTGYTGIGMAMRPGVKAFLQSQGVEFLYPKEGMNAIINELERGEVPEIVLTGNLGKLDWDGQLEFNPDFGAESTATPGERFIEKGNTAALSAEKEFSLEKDPYLADHAINGIPYVPGVMGVETFAEAARFFTGKEPGTLGNVKFILPVKLHKNRPVKTRIKGERAKGILSMRLESDFINARGVKMGPPRIHFSAECPREARSRFCEADIPRTSGKINYKVSAGEIYQVYFHGPSFRVLDGIATLEKNRVLAVYKKPVKPLWPAGGERLLLHPMAMEAAFQTAGYRDIHFEKTMALPHSVDWVIIHSKSAADTLFVYCEFLGTREGKSVNDIFVFDKNKKPVLEVLGYVGIPTRI